MTAYMTSKVRQEESLTLVPSESRIFRVTSPYPLHNEPGSPDHIECFAIRLLRRYCRDDFEYILAGGGTRTAVFPESPGMIDK